MKKSEIYNTTPFSPANNRFVNIFMKALKMKPTKREILFAEKYAKNYLATVNN